SANGTQGLSPSSGNRRRVTISRTRYYTAGECQEFCVRDFCEGWFAFWSIETLASVNGQPLCLAAPSGQAPKPRSGAPKARVLMIFRKDRCKASTALVV